MTRRKKERKKKERSSLSEDTRYTIKITAIVSVFYVFFATVIYSYFIKSLKITNFFGLELEYLFDNLVWILFPIVLVIVCTSAKNKKNKKNKKK